LPRDVELKALGKKADVLAPLLAEYAKHCDSGERFSDYVIRAGLVHATTAGNRFHLDHAARP
jgi:sulfite reductase beta subunit-like hemoprotein